MQISLRNISALLLARLLIILGVVRSAKMQALNGEYILSIYFHSPSKKEFESCVKWLQKNKFCFLSTSDLERIIKKELSFPKGAVLLTVDDGWQSIEENVITVANKYAVPVTVFVSTAPVEEGTFWWSYCRRAKPNENKQYIEALKKVSNTKRLEEVEKLKEGVALEREALTIEQIKRAAQSKYITIGGHTHTHPILTNCSDDEVRNELQLSKQKLEQWTGKKVNYFAYPNGDYGLREKQILNELNYDLAFNIKAHYLTPDRLTDTYSIPRFCFVEGASFAENICRMVGVWKFTKVWLMQHSRILRSFNKLYPASR